MLNSNRLTLEIGGITPPAHIAAGQVTVNAPLGLNVLILIDLPEILLANVSVILLVIVKKNIGAKSQSTTVPPITDIPDGISLGPNALNAGAADEPSEGEPKNLFPLWFTKVPVNVPAVLIGDPVTLNILPGSANPTLVTVPITPTGMEALRS